MGGQLDQAGAPLLGRVPQPQVQDRQLLLQVGPEQHHGGGGAGLVDRGARQRQHDLGVSPSPSWASTWSVPSTPLASLAHA